MIFTNSGSTLQKPFLKALDRVRNTLGLAQDYTERIYENSNIVQALEDTKFLEGLSDDEEDSADMIQQSSNINSFSVLNIPTSPPPSLYQRFDICFR